ncbi:MAG: aminotransferase class III-fold pyridoxal phosphate-dependent enzyme, partial [SAR324 cluster bacterium]|nr:aminotransferase class III-fold pyridoxal phosphate-dependent enzyme [SAR324 cluster bacterium]
TFHKDLKVMHLRQAFHGRSGYTLSLTNTDPVKTEFFPKFDWPRLENPKKNFPDEGNAHDELKRREMLSIVQAKHAVLTHGDSIAACIVEPIQGEGGDNHFRPEYLMTLQAICQENGIMFIVDEIQTGVGLTGKMWAYEHYGLKPDMLCFGKKTQVCGFLSSDRIDEVEDNVFAASGRINSTWGGTLVDMVRCSRYLEIIEEEKLIDNAAKMGELLLKGLHELQNDFSDIVSNSRGKGLMCAFDVKTTDMRNSLRNTAFEKGMLVLNSGEKSIRFRPALNVGEGEISKAMQILRDILPTVV